MSIRSAIDVTSCCGRVRRMLNTDSIGSDTLKKCKKYEFEESSIFIKSQLKGAVALCIEFEKIPKKD